MVGPPDDLSSAEEGADYTLSKVTAALNALKIQKVAWLTRLPSGYVVASPVGGVDHVVIGHGSQLL